MDIKQYRKKPVVIDAVQWDGTLEGANEIAKWAQENGADVMVQDSLDGSMVEMRIPTLEGGLNVSPQDWVIRGTKSEFYPCKPDVFADVYEDA